MRDVVIVSGARSPVGSFGMSLKSVPVVNLGAAVLKETLKRVKLRPKASNELIGYEPDALKGSGMIGLEKEAYDYDDSMQAIQVASLSTFPKKIFNVMKLVFHLTVESK